MSVEPVPRTENEPALVELTRLNGELRRLTANLMTFQETERRRISREIHDELGQQLTCMRIELARLKEEGARGGDLTLPLAAMETQIAAAFASMRRIATQIRPPALEDLGLAEALEGLVTDFQRRSGISCELVDTADSTPPSQEIAIAVYRVVQEALTNCARHSEAAHIRVDVRKPEGRLLVTVQDDGIGIPEDSAPEGLGLIGMRERVHGVGGTFRVARGPNGGTRVDVEIPLGRGAPSV